MNWHNLSFSSDAQNVVKEIMCKGPCGWHTRNRVLEIKRTLAAKEWCMNWKTRTSNILAHALAKKSLASTCTGTFSSLSLCNIPADLENALIDMAGICSSFVTSL